MSNGNVRKSKLKSQAAPFVRPKVKSQSIGTDVAPSARAVSCEGGAAQPAMQSAMDEHNGEVTRLTTEMDVWCAISSPASGYSPTSITVAIDQHLRFICGIVVPSDQHDAACNGTKFNKENANV